MPTQIDAHFTPGKPHGFTKEARQLIVEKVNQIEGLYRTEQEMMQCQFPFPSDTSEPVAVLGPPAAGGLCCTLEKEAGNPCHFVGRNVKRMQEHSWSEHGWKSKKKGGRPRKTDVPQEDMSVPWRSGVSYQRFFKQGPRSGFFEVSRGL